MARQYGAMKGRGAGNNRRRRMPPAETQELYVSALTFGKSVQAAAEFEMTVDELAEEAMLAHLRVKAAELFEREFYAAKMEADQGPISLKRYEFERTYRRPAWDKDSGPRPPDRSPE